MTQKTPVSVLASFYQCQLGCWWCLLGFCLPFRSFWNITPPCCFKSFSKVWENWLGQNCHTYRFLSAELKVVKTVYGLAFLEIQLDSVSFCFQLLTQNTTLRHI